VPGQRAEERAGGVQNRLLIGPGAEGSKLRISGHSKAGASRPGFALWRRDEATDEFPSRL